MPKFEVLAAVLLMTFGLLVRIVTPPYQLADEINHFARAWQISQGKFLSPTIEVRAIERGDNPTTRDQIRWSCRGGRVTLKAEDEEFFAAEVPRSLMPSEFAIDVVNKFHAVNFGMQRKFLATPLNVDDTERHLIPNTGSYAPPAYFPQATATFVGRLMNWSAGAIYYAMSMSALLFVTACTFAAMKLLPEKKFLIFVLASLPMFLTEAASSSADAVIYAACLLGTAWLLSLRRSSEQLSTAEIFALMMFAVTLGLLKQVYGAILLLYWLIPRRRFKSMAQFVGVGVALILLELATSLAWLTFSGDFGRVPLFTGFYMGLEGIDPAAQKNFVLAHPTEFLAALVSSLMNQAVWFPKTFFGVLGIVNVYFPKIFYVGLLIALMVVASFGRLQLRWTERLIIFVAVAVTVAGVFGVEYLVWSSVGANIISGVQGRYFLPIALMALASLSAVEPPKFAAAFALAVGIFSAAATVWITFARFY
ncbi:MAG: DUF2142 domain-containing protein [Quinella sp. 2Q5]|nr:DUF2142 domain-containing protein [Quinella sp. 2Q5]